MTAKTNVLKKTLSLLLVLALLITCLPLSVIAADTQVQSIVDREVDPTTMDAWKQYFLPTSGALSTENAGGIWTDKSVMLDASAFAGSKDLHGHTMSMTDSNSFLVALSAIASNMSIVGRGGMPTDTMLVLDVSGSMGSGYNNVARELVDAANTSIAALLENENNRVGVVLYSSSATTMLPLDYYTTASDGNYLSYSSGRISIDSDVRNSSGSRLDSRGREVSGGTYIQTGILDALDEFVSSGNTDTANRKPVIVLMSDGAPTYGNTDFINLDNNRFGSGSASSAALGFVTQLTASYAKQQIQEKYGVAPLFYTLSLAIGNGTTNQSSAQAEIDKNVAISVLDPANTVQSIKDLWTKYDNASVGSAVNIGGNRNVAKVAGLSYSYVDRYFNSDDYTGDGTNTLAQALQDAFADIVAEISLQSAYYPTLVQGEQAHSGYITFVDKIGEYMSVTDIKGLVLGDTLFSGIDLAQNFTPAGGALGTQANPTTLGDTMLEAVMQRLSITDVATARALIDSAYNYKQLYYDAETDEFSNYIGWYADASGKYVGFWYEGITAAPPADAVSIVKSYGYLGEVNHHTKSDMMFATVQLRYDIATGEEILTFAIPAALVPVITYKVSLDENNALVDLAATGATDPIRLVYEIALDPDIDSINVKDMVGEEYLNKADYNGNKTNEGPNGEVYFYTNQYEVAASATDSLYGYGKVNTYSYFRPSQENDRYYYQEDTAVYTDTNGTPATSIVAGNTYYHAYQVYTKAANGKLEIQEVYHVLAQDTLNDAESGAGGMYIPAGHVRRDYSNPNYEHHDIVKAENKTQTLPDVAYPFTDIRGLEEVGGVPNYSFVFGSTLGNNGRIALMPATGIRIEKLFDGTDAAGADFTFTITGAVPNGDYTARKIDANGVAGEEMKVTFSSGKATVTLKAGESIDIIGLAAGTVLSIAEAISEDYILQTTTGLTAGNVTVAVNEIQTVSFTNAIRGTGNLTIAKEVEHPFATAPAALSTKEFSLTVTLTLEGAPLANKSYNNGAITTDANGKIQQQIKLKHGQQLTILNLPAGTEATVVEADPGAGFTPSYWDNGEQGDGVVLIEAGRTASVIVLNDYVPTVPVFPVNISLSGVKTLKNREWNSTDSYTFVLEQYDFTNRTWVELASREVTMDTADKKFSFDDVFAASTFKYTEAGTYYYRVREAAGNIAGVSYDTSLHSFAVVVADDDMDGALEIKSVVETATGNPIAPVENKYQLNANFTNVYNEGETDVAIEVQKTVVNPTNSPLASQAGFSFQMTPVAGNPADDPLSGSSQTVTSTLAGVARFSLHYTSADTYKYTVVEINDAKRGYSYDETVYNVTVVTSSTGGYLTAQVTVEKAGDTPASSSLPLVFENTYLKDAKVPLDLDFVEKHLDGRKLLAGEFDFVLTAATGTSPLVNAAGAAISGIEGRNNADGTVTFDQPLYFDQVGIYHYNINEVQGNVHGVTYDENTHRVTVTVTDNGGELAVSYVLVDTEGDAAVFENSFTPDPITHMIDGTKQVLDAAGALSARPLRYGEFTFVMTEVDSQGQPLVNAPVYTVRNELDGSFAFPAITYTGEGVHYYQIVEENAGKRHLGVTNSSQSFTVKVVITKSEDGILNKQVTVNNGTAPMVFSNTYTAETVKLVLSGQKNIDGRDRNETDIYSFELYGKEGLMEIQKNDHTGMFVFSELTYSEVGVHTYTVKETVGSKGGIIYDTTELKVTVEVLDDYLGKLYTRVSVVDDEGNPREGIIFTNQYQVTENATVKLSGEKTLNGRPMVDGEFTFELIQMVEGAAVGDPQIVSNKDGKFTFALEYTPVDVGKTFTYVVKETHAGETINDVTYSKAEYHITVVVGDDGEGHVTADTTITLDGKAATSLDFINEYDGKVSVSIAVSKLVDNKNPMDTITPEGFSFLLEKVGTSEKFTVKTDKDGKAVFVMSFNPEDIGKTYHYILTEVNDEKPGVTYSTQQYTIAISVSLNDQQQMVATLMRNGEAVEQIVAEFVNIYGDDKNDETADVSGIMLIASAFFAGGSGLIGTVMFGKKQKEEEA